MPPMSSHCFIVRPISIDSSSGSIATHHPVNDTSSVLRVDRVRSCDKRPVTIVILPDDVLLHIFHFVRVTSVDLRTYPNGLTLYIGRRDLVAWRLSWWRPLLHVCRKWRSIVFASPNFLDLKLVCNHTTRAELTGIWPPLPIIIRNEDYLPMPEDYDFDAAIVHPNRVCEIELNLTSSQLQRLASAMQEQSPALIKLTLVSRPAQALPDGFLGESAPRLRTLRLRSIAFPALPKLLLSATDLTHLSLENIPRTGYISPEVVVTALAVMTNLYSLKIEFEYPLLRRDWESRPPPQQARTVLSALTDFEFKGVSEYLEDLVARINAPLLNSTQIKFFHQFIFSIPQLAQFMRRTTRMKALNEAHVFFGPYGVWVQFSAQTASCRLWILCTTLEWQLLSLAQLSTSLFPSISMIENLSINPSIGFQTQWQNGVEDTQWPEIFNPFIAVKTLHVSADFLQSIALDLKDLVEERVMHVLPTLETLVLEGLQPSGPVQEAIEQFVTARQHLGHPVTVCRSGGK